MTTVIKKSHQHVKKLRTYRQVVKYLPVTYTTKDIIAGAGAKVIIFNQRTRTTCVRYSEANRKSTSISPYIRRIMVKRDLYRKITVNNPLLYAYPVLSAQKTMLKSLSSLTTDPYKVIEGLHSSTPRIREDVTSRQNRLRHVAVPQ